MGPWAVLILDADDGGMGTAPVRLALDTASSENYL